MRDNLTRTREKPLRTNIARIKQLKLKDDFYLIND
jgi:hypothetical protein